MHLFKHTVLFFPLFYKKNGGLHLFFVAKCCKMTMIRNLECFHNLLISSIIEDDIILMSKAFHFVIIIITLCYVFAYGLYYVKAPGIKLFSTHVYYIFDTLCFMHFL